MACFVVVAEHKDRRPQCSDNGQANAIMIRSRDVKGRSAGDGGLVSADLRTPFALTSFNGFQLVHLAHSCIPK